MKRWTPQQPHDPSDPSTPSVARAPFGLADALSLSSLSIRLGDHHTAPLPTPSSASPRPPTPHGASEPATTGPGVLSPPTPAPSPTPKLNRWSSESSGRHAHRRVDSGESIRQEEGEEEAEIGRVEDKGKGREGISAGA